MLMSKLKGQKIDQVTSQILDLGGQKKSLEIEIESIKLKLANDGEQQRMALEKERHTHGLELSGAKKDMDRQKQIFEEDKARITAKLKDEHSSEIEKLKKESGIQLVELKSLAKLDSEQRISQAELDAKKRVQELEAKHTEGLSKARTEHAQELSKVRSDLSVEYYDKMQKALLDMNTEGSSQMKFINELTMKMFDKGLEKATPMAPLHMITETRTSTVEA